MAATVPSVVQGGRVRRFCKGVRDMQTLSALRLFATSFAAMCLYSGPLCAQTGTSFNLEGNLLDPSGAVIATGTITVKNVDLGLTRTAQTNAQGHYTFAALPPDGTYEITADAAGFGSQTKTGLHFQANTSPVIDFNLTPGTVHQTVSVTGEAPLVESATSEFNHTVTSQAVQDLPLNGRNFFDYVGLTPGAVREGSGSGNITLNGQGIRQLTILADGVPNQLREIRTLEGDLTGANGTFSLDVVQEVQVITNGYSAEFGRSMAGIVNTITRSGTNEFHGDAFLYGRPGAVAADNPLTKQNPDLNREQWGGTIGGPIIKDKLHFLGNYEQTAQNQNAVGITTPLQSQTGTLLNIPFHELKAFAKVDAQLNANNRIEARYSVIRSKAENQNVGGLNTTERADTSSDHTQEAEISATSVLNPHLVNEARFAYTRDLFLEYQAIVGPGLPPNFSNVGPAITYSGVGNTGPDPSLPQDLDENGLTWQDKVSHTIGSHNLKYGVEFSKYLRFVTFYNNFTGSYTFAPGTPRPFNPSNPATYPNRYTQAFGISGLNYNEYLAGSFVQDDWNVNRQLTLNIGLRYDYESLMHDTNNFAPRFGFAWNPKNNGKTVIRGSFGIFYATIETSMINRESNNGPNGIVTLSLTPNDPLFPRFPNSFTSVPTGANFVLSDVFIPLVRGLSTKDFPDSVGNQFGGLRVNPYDEMATLQIQRQLTKNTLVSVDYIHVHGLKLLRTEDLNEPPFFEVGPGLVRTQAQADAQRPYGVPSRTPGPLGIAFGGYRRLLIQESGDQSFYDAMDVRLTKRFSRRFMLDGFYTFSKAISDSDNFRESSALHMDPANYLLDRGLSDQDRRHNFVMNGIFNLPWGLRLGGILSAVSGIHYTGAVGFDAMGIATTRDERPGEEGRNTFTAPAVVNLDANLSRDFHIHERQLLEGRFEVFNVTNRFNIAGVNNVIGLNPAAPPSTFGLPTSTAAGRQLQFALRYSF